MGVDPGVLTPRELDVIRALGRYGSQKAAAERLGIAYPTVRNILSTARQRTGLHAHQLVYLSGAGKLK